MRLAAAIPLLLATVLPAQSKATEQALRASNEAYRAGEFAKGIEILQALDDRHVDARVKQQLSALHSRRGLTRYKAGKLDLAYKDYAAADRHTPGNEAVLQSLGVITFNQKRPHDAERFMQRVLKINPNNQHALGILGRIAANRDNAGKASKYLGKAAEIAPDRKDYSKLATKLGKEAEVEKRFVTLLRGNFRVQFERGKTVGVERAVQTVHGYLEQAYREFALLLGGRPAKRITVVVYNRDQYQKVSSAHSWAKAYYDGKLRVAVKQWPAGRDELRRDLRHELVHAFLHEIYKNTPLWLHEGLAQIAEGASAAAARGKFTSGKYRLLPLKTFTGRFADARTENVVHRGYAQSLMLVSHLQKIGNRRQVHSLLREISRGTDPDKALRLVYRKGIEELLQDAVR